MTFCRLLVLLGMEDYIRTRNSMLHERGQIQEVWANYCNSIWDLSGNVFYNHSRTVFSQSGFRVESIIAGVFKMK